MEAAVRIRQIMDAADAAAADAAQVRAAEQPILDVEFVIVICVQNTSASQSQPCRIGWQGNLR